MLKIALPGGKSLEAGTIRLFSNAFISIKRKGESSHKVSFPDYQDISNGVFVKPARSPKLVEKGVYDLAITGLDVVLESKANVEMLTSLTYGRNSSGETRGVLFAHKDDSVVCVEDIPPVGSVILSEYPYQTKKFLKSFGLDGVRVISTTGSVEAEVPDRYRFGVCLTETGKSLRENELKEIATIFISRTVLIANKDSLKDKKKCEAIQALKLILLGTLEAELYLLLTMNVPLGSQEGVLKLLPSFTSPTVAHLVSGVPFVSVSSAIKKNEVNSIIPKLLKLGVEGLFLQSMASMISRW